VHCWYCALCTTTTAVDSTPMAFIGLRFAGCAHQCSSCNNSVETPTPVLIGPWVVAVGSLTVQLHCLAPMGYTYGLVVACCDMLGPAAALPSAPTVVRLALPHQPAPDMVSLHHHLGCQLQLHSKQTPIRHPSQGYSPLHAAGCWVVRPPTATGLPSALPAVGAACAPAVGSPWQL
jgi:hypothetical protein